MYSYNNSYNNYNKDFFLPTNRSQAVVLAQALLDAQWIECVTSNDYVFKDEYSLYRPGKVCSMNSTWLMSSALHQYQ